MLASVSFKADDELVESEEVEIEEFNERNIAIFEMKEPKNQLNDESGHEVYFNLIFSLAIPGTFNNIKTMDSISTRNSTSDLLGRNTLNLFHIEFDLFPSSIVKETYKTDVILFGNYARIFPDKCESRCIPTWCDGEDTWICFNQRFKFFITDTHIRHLCSHKMQIKLWDTKDKLDPKVRFYRPKPPKWASRTKSKMDTQNWIKHMVHSMSRQYYCSAAYKEDQDRILPHQLSPTTPTSPKSSHTTKTLKSSQSGRSTSTSKTKEAVTLGIYDYPRESVNSQMDSYAQLEKLVESGTKNQTIKPKSHTADAGLRRQSGAVADSRFSIANSINNLSFESKHNQTPIETEEYHKMGRTSLDVSMTDLFIKNSTVSRSPASVNSLEDVFCMVSIESPLLSDNQVKRLSPLTIKIKSINNLPPKGQDLFYINKLYQPIFCEYQFANSNLYRSISRFHNSTVYFDDISVILLGDLDELTLKRQMVNSFFKIKLFDRIKKPEQNPMSINEFDRVDTMNIGDINMTSNQPTVTFNKIDQHFGEAKIDLSDIVKKQLKFLEILTPIVPVSLLSFDSDLINKEHTNETDYNNYLESGTTIKLSFHLANNIQLNMDEINKNNIMLNRLILINNNVQCQFIRTEINNLIVDYNCEKLEFISCNLSEKQSFLFSLDLNNVSEHDDLYCGSFIVDREMELLIVESRSANINKLYENICVKLDASLGSLENDIKMLYDETCTFVESTNYNLLSMIPLILSKNLASFVSQPLLYVRDTIPKDCTEGICRMFQLVNSHCMSNAVRNELIPNRFMLKSISQYLCSHLNKMAENNIQRNFDENIVKVTANQNQIATAPQIKQSINIKSRKLGTRSKSMIKSDYISGNVAFSYSNQSNNAIQSALQELRQQMIPNRMYTYSQDYLFSGNVSPVDLEQTYLNQEKQLNSEQKWIQKGKSTLLQDFSKSFDLPESKRDELNEKWQEKRLFRGVLEPTLPERDNRDHQFDLLIRPLNIIERDSKSAMPNYMTEIADRKSQIQRNEEEFKSKMCVLNSRVGVHRVLPNTELTERGRISSNQLDKLKGIRKDKKLHIKGLVGSNFSDTNRIPALSVIQNCSKVLIADHSFTVGGFEEARNLSINYLPMKSRGKYGFKTIHVPSSESTVYKRSKIQRETQPNWISPFTIYG